MHPALHIHEIVLNIADQWVRQRDLCALARTCRAFKEPVLDALWEALDDLSPVVRCLPEASHAHPSDHRDVMCYSFRRPLTPKEWQILLSYTRRIRSLVLIGPSAKKIGHETLDSLTRPSTGQLVFPNLYFLSLDYTGIEEERTLFLLPLPSLVSVNLSLESPHHFDTSIKLFAKNAPNLKKFIIPHSSHGLDISGIDFRFICQWKHLRIVAVSDIFLDIDTVTHLSHTCTLTELAFSVSDRLVTTSPAVPLSFPSLLDITLNCTSLTTAWKLLSHTLLPVIKRATVIFDQCPSKEDISLLATTPFTSFLGHTIQHLTMVQPERETNPTSDPQAVLGFEHLQSCTAFSDLRSITLDMKCKVNLADHELLALASAWPRVVRMGINGSWGWKTQGGITPDGLLQLLLKCPSLRDVELAMNVRGYTDTPPSPASLGLTTRPLMLVNVVDSVIERDSVLAVAAFFSGIVAVHPHVHMMAWHTASLAEGTAPILADRFWDCWMEVRARVKNVIDQQLGSNLS